MRRGKTTQVLCWPMVSEVRRSQGFRVSLSFIPKTKMHSSIFKHLGPTGISVEGKWCSFQTLFIRICMKNTTVVSLLYHLLFSGWALSANALLKTIFSGLMVFL